MPWTEPAMTWRCPCGSRNREQDRFCEQCGAAPTARGAKRDTRGPDPDQCSRCDTTSKSTAPFHSDDPEALPEDRGQRLCPSCWIAALKRRAAGQTRESRCTEPGCDKTAAEHIADFRRYGEIIMARMGAMQ